MSAGEEENNYVLQQTLRETIYGAGVTWNPGPRTSAEFEYEHRFFGPSRLARGVPRTRLTAWNLVYSRNTSTFQDEVLRIHRQCDGAARCDLRRTHSRSDQRRAAVDEFVRGSGTPATLSSSLAFYTQRVYLREAIEASFGILGVRNSITFTAFYARTATSPPTPGIPAGCFPLRRPLRRARLRRARRPQADAVHHAQRKACRIDSRRKIRPARRPATTMSRLR